MSRKFEGSFLLELIIQFKTKSHFRAGNVQLDFNSLRYSLFLHLEIQCLIFVSFSSYYVIVKFSDFHIKVFFDTRKERLNSELKLI